MLLGRIEKTTRLELIDAYIELSVARCWGFTTFLADAAADTSVLAYADALRLALIPSASGPSNQGEDLGDIRKDPRGTDVTGHYTMPANIAFLDTAGIWQCYDLPALVVHSTLLSTPGHLSILGHDILRYWKSKPAGRQAPLT